MNSSNILSDLTPGKVIDTARIKAKENRKKIFSILQFLALIGVGYLFFYYPKIGERYGFSSFYLKVALFYIFANLMISVSRILLVNIYIKRNHLKDDYRDNFIIGVDRIASLLSIVSLIAAVLYLFEVDPVELFTTLSIVAAALALLFKDYILNLINGMIIMFSDHLSLNEYIKIGEYKGRIVDINLINLILKTDEGDLIYIPNNVVFSRDVINYSKSDMSIAIVEFDLPASLFGKLQQLESFIMERIGSRFETHVKADNISLKVVRIKKDEAQLKLLVTLNKHNPKMEKMIRRFANHLILEFIDKIAQENMLRKEAL